MKRVQIPLTARILRAMSSNSSRRPARAADVFAMVGGAEPAFWDALNELIGSRQIQTAHIMRPKKGETQPWLAIWPTGVKMASGQWSARSMGGVFVRHEPESLLGLNGPRVRAQAPAKQGAKA